MQKRNQLLLLLLLKIKIIRRQQNTVFNRGGRSILVNFQFTRTPLSSRKR